MPASPLQRVVRHLRRAYAPTTDADLLRRFAAVRDADAFAALAARHGPLVWGACRRILGDRHAAEDVFQATFLELARRAGSIRQPAALPAWLYGVAVRLARRARARSGRRPHVESAARPPAAPTDPLAEVSGRELVAVIDDELARLPEPLRLPLLLCCVEGLSREEAARRLAWTDGMVKGRLERGRELLRQRLTARGLTLPAVLTSVLAADATAAVPRELIAATSRAALAALTAPAAWGSLKALAVAAVVLTTLGVGAGALVIPASRERERPESAPTAGARAPGSPEQTAAPPPRVDAEGVPLPPGALARLGSSRLRHAGYTLPLAFAPDGRSFASAGSDAVRVWEAATGKRLRQIDLRNNRDLHFAADGRELVVLTAGPDVELFSIDTATGRELRHATLAKDGSRETPDGIAFSSSGRRLAVSFVQDKKIHLFDTATGRETLTIPFTEFRARGLAFAPDEQTLAVAAFGDAVRLHDTITGAVTAELKRENAEFFFVAFSPNGQMLTTIAAKGQGGAGHQVELWDVPTRQTRHKLAADGLTQPVGATFSPDGRLVVVCGQPYDVILFETATGKEFRRLRCIQNILRAAFTPDGRTLAVAGNSGTITLWDVETGRPLPASADPIISIYNLRYTADGGRLLGVSDRIIAWDPAAGREVHRFPDMASIIGLPMLSPDERLIAVRTREGIRLSDAASGREVRALVRGEKKYFHQFTFTPDGRRLIASDYDYVISIWDVADGKLVREMTGHTGVVNHLTVSLDGRWLASSNRARGDDAIRLWDLMAFREVRRFTPRTGLPFALAFSADSRLLAATGGELGQGDDTGIVQVWDVATGRELRSFTGHTAQAYCVAFSPDGRTLATGSLDTTVRLWEVATGGERRRITGHAGTVQAVAFAPDGRALAAASFDAPVYVWDVLGLSERPRQPPTAADLEDAWAALAGADAKAAFQAIGRLVAAPEPAVAFLRERLKPAVPADAQRVRALIRQLDIPRFAERQQATQELEALADRAAAELRAALKDAGSLELRQRLERLLDRVETGTSEMFRATRAVEALEYIATPAARQHLTALAGGAPGAALTDAATAALKRLSP